jgi:excisionase family DNA binding protein
MLRLVELKSKREAAEMLGVSTRGIERAVRRGQLAVQYRDSKHGKKAWFRPVDLERYQRRQETRVPMGFTSLPVQQLPPPGPGPTIGAVIPVVDMDDWPRKNKDKDKRKHDDNPVPIADRLTLRLQEAVQLSGLPHSFLLENIRQGKLKAITIGRRHYVKRADLNEFVQAL